LQLLLRHVSLDAMKVALVLALSFLVGLEREEHKARDANYAFGGVRTFPLIGLIGYATALMSGPQLIPVAVGFAVVGGFMMLSYRRKLSDGGGEGAGITSEMSGLITYLVGALISYGHLWIATTLIVASVLLLELKSALETLTRRLAADEIISLAKFLLLSAVILPVVPDERFTRYNLNPFKTWLIVVAVSGVSYGSYLLQKLVRGRGGVFVSGVLGGAYSSTVTTVVLARQARSAPHPHLYAGSILAASGMMYLRLLLLMALFSRPLLTRLGPPFVVLAVAALLAGWLWSRRRDDGGDVPELPAARRNPLELGAALLFALLFVIVMVLTQVVLEHVGRSGIYSLAAIMGVADVDPFILGLTQTAAKATPETIAAVAILIAAASNNAAKGIYALAFADRRSGVTSLILLVALALFGLVPWLWM
jgi:uncharacterized membrane protein (DUF4010 family)